MVLHVAWLMQLAQRWAAGDPVVVAGDFNIKPGAPQHPPRARPGLMRRQL
jgi:endonuclease/exonuclease/phosphatase family metal-dependent hydrolase